MTQQEKDKIIEYVEYINNLNHKSLIGESVWNGLSLYQKLYLNILWKQKI